MQSWGSLLPYLLFMACNYENEAMGKFLLPSQPDEGNFTLRMAYEAVLKVYQCDHMHVMEVHEWWKQGEQIKDVHQEAEAARARAVAKKEHREKSSPGNIITLRRRRWRPVHPLNVASDVTQKVHLSVGLCLCADIWHRSHVCMQAECFMQ